MKYFKVLNEIQSLKYNELFNYLSVGSEERKIPVITDGNFLYVEGTDENAALLYKNNISVLSGHLNVGKTDLLFLTSIPAHSVQLILPEFNNTGVAVDLTDWDVDNNAAFHNPNDYLPELGKWVGRYLSNNVFKTFADPKVTPKDGGIVFTIYQRRPGYARAVEVIAPRVGIAKVCLKKVRETENGMEDALVLVLEPKYQMYHMSTNK